MAQAIAADSVGSDQLPHVQGYEVSLPRSRMLKQHHNLTKNTQEIMLATWFL
jgi:hypothetical protein